jgi:hypothetical protein
MPDISMCSNTMCLLNNSCYRFKANPSPYQMYANFEPESSGHCHYYYKIEEMYKPIEFITYKIKIKPSTKRICLRS